MLYGESMSSHDVHPQIQKIAAALAEHGAHGSVRVLADPTFVRRHTGQAIGGVAPIGHPSPVRTLVDRWLDHHTTVWASAGHPQAVFSTTYTQLLELTKGTPTEVEETPRLDD